MVGRIEPFIPYNKRNLNRVSKSILKHLTPDLLPKKYLIQNGVAPERLYPIGFGSSKPVYAKPQDEEQKEANRRVEILIRKN